jgi:hypothetical protein
MTVRGAHVGEEFGERGADNIDGSAVRNGSVRTAGPLDELLLPELPTDVSDTASVDT